MTPFLTWRSFTALLATWTHCKFIQNFIFFSDPKEDAIEKSKFLTAFCKGVTEAQNMLHLGELGAGLAEKVLQYWMTNIGRSLTNYQV